MYSKDYKQVAICCAMILISVLYMEFRRLIKHASLSFSSPETHFREDAHSYQKLHKASKENPADLVKQFSSSMDGLSHEEAIKRTKQYGYNVITQEKGTPWYFQLLKSFRNPFNALLLVLAAISYFTGDVRATIVMIFMVLLSVLLGFIQEFKSSKAADKLKALVKTTCTVLRTPKDKKKSEEVEIRLKDIVPGDIVLLNAGDLIPADVRILESQELFVSQAVLTGESVPSEKHATVREVHENKHKSLAHQSFDVTNICYMGTNVVSGTAKAIVILTGSQTYFGSLAKEVITGDVETSFDKGINKVSYLLIRFMLVMVPIVFLLNGLTKGNWTEAFLFAISIAVGLTPEMLPMIITSNLAKGALDMSKRKVVVKHLAAIQNFGGMDILCTDKTGTLTQDKIVLKYYQDVHGNENKKILEYCYINSFYQTGLQNLLDKSILQHHEYKEITEKSFKKINEIPFDFERRKMSVIVESEKDKHLLICKGAAEEIMKESKNVEIDGKQQPFTPTLKQQVRDKEREFNEQGFRVISIAYRKEPAAKTTFSKEDEKDLTFLGFLAFLDPPKESAAKALETLRDYGITIKILTGDNDIVTRKICADVGLNVDTIVLGEDLDKLTDKELRILSEKTTVFAKLNPMQKARIVQSLRRDDHTIGYMGDGINDAPSLKQADIGISVDSAVDIAKESADIILLEKNLLVLKEGVIRGRITFGNTMKYLKATASSNFGNVFSVLGSSVILPFLPMRPIHLLIQNLLYDFSQATIPTDNVDEDYLKAPKKWHAEDIGRFMIFLGPISSLFDYTTFAILWFVLQANTPASASVFQTGWFVEGLLTQVLIVHLLRTRKISFFQSRASLPLTLMTILVMLLGIILPYTPAGHAVGLVPLPLIYFPYLLATLVGYAIVMQLAKQVYIKKFGSWV